MKKFILLAGLAAMIAASPAFAATKTMVHKPAAMCMLHGKKVLCSHICIVHGKKAFCPLPKKHHVMHKTVKHVVKKKK